MVMNNIINIIKKSNRIAITFHVSPDGDSLGSSLALMQGLSKLGKDVYIMCKEAVPEYYSFLPYSFEADNKHNSVEDNTDCVIVLDCGNFDRISANLELKNKNYTLINIDHHLSNDLYGDLNFVDTNSASVGEVIYQLLKLIGVTIDKDMAVCLYTSIVTDTGGFRHSNTTSVTHTIAGDLINIGIDFSELHRILFENKKFNRVKLYGKIINNLELINGKVCIMELTKKMLTDLNVDESDTSDLVNIGMEIEGVEVAALLKEKGNLVKVSLRSKSIVDVRKIAENFGGGGHMRASGLSLNKDLKEAKEIMIKAIEKELI